MATKTTLKELGGMLTYVVENMATKDDVAGILSELRDIKQRLKTVEEAVSDHSGYSKEIDLAFERIAAIEKHLGIKHPVSQK